MPNNTTPDPNPSALSLPWKGDFEQDENGSLKMITGVPKVDQRIIRRLLTNPSFVLEDGTVVTAEDYFDQDYGIGLRRIEGQPAQIDFIKKLEQKIKEGVLVDEGVDSTQQPTIALFVDDKGALYIEISYVLIDQQDAVSVLRI